MRVLWNAICDAESILDGAENPAQTLQACYALAQAAGQYARLLEVGEYEARIAALEKQLTGGSV